MENKFYTDDFEQFLKDTTDDFRMYPSKRVWNSLYNNLHPGRKWPSLAVCLLLVSSVIFIGLSHKNEISGSADLAKKNTGTSQLVAYKNESNNSNTKILSATNPVNVAQTQAITAAGSIAAGENLYKPAEQSYTTSVGQSAINNTIPGKNAGKRTNGNNDFVTGAASHGVRRSVKAATQFNLIPSNPEDYTPENKNTNGFLQKYTAAVPVSQDKTFDLSLVEKNNPRVTIPLLAAIKKTKNTSEKEWIEDYAFHHQPIPSLKSKLQYQFYVTPSTGFRTLTQNASYSAPARPSLVTNPVPDGPNPLQHNYGFNLEGGYSIVYAYSRSMHLKGGLQFNYTNYRIHAHELGHSTYTYLLLNDPYSSNAVQLSQRSSKLANLSGAYNDKKLNNSTFQVSLPLGVDLKVAGKHNLQWFVGATVQPTYVLFGNAYLISSDLKNYVYDSKFLRKWNVNAAVEAFVSYKTKKGITFNAGPQFRYQFLSTYKDKYSFTEKLYNVGIKLGMTRNF